MEIISSVMRRRSCREYTQAAVTDEQLRQLVAAGMQAPSARNERPWEFLVVCSEAGKQSLAQASPYAKMCRNAAAVIVVLANMDRIAANSPWWVQDVSACTENILIRATDLGLGAVWLGMYPRQDRMQAIREAFSLPERCVPFAAIPVGYPAKEAQYEDHFDETRICWVREGETTV